VQLIAEKEILMVVASLFVHCCAITKNVTAALQLYDIADVQSTIEKEGRPPWTFAVYSKAQPWELCSK